MLIDTENLEKTAVKIFGLEIVSLVVIYVLLKSM